MAIEPTTDARERLIDHILELEPEMFRAMGPVEPNPWLDVDISMSQLKVLMALAWADPEGSSQGLRMSDLSRYLGVTPATVTVVVDRLEERGLVERQHDAQDRRQHRCVLTATAQDMMERICESARLRTQPTTGWTIGGRAAYRGARNAASDSLRSSKQSCENRRTRATRLSVSVGGFSLNSYFSSSPASQSNAARRFLSESSGANGFGVVLALLSFERNGFTGSFFLTFFDV